MKPWHCNRCDTVFLSERSTACLRCGSTDICPLDEIPSHEASEPQRETDIGDLKGILRDLCREAYETPYGSAQWDEAIDKTMDRLGKYLKSEVIESA